MALKVWDGFDHYLNATDWKSRLNNFVQYQQPATNGTPISFVTGRNGFGKALYLEQGNTYSYAVFGQRVSSAFVGFACQFNETGTGADFTFFDTVTGLGNVNVFFNPANYSVQIYRGDRQVSGAVLLYAGPNNQWADNVWNFIEIWPVIDASTGSVTVHVNGVTVAAVTGVNTVFSETSYPFITANAWWDAMAMRAYNISGSPGMCIDDLYYADTTTGPGLTPCNTFLGDCRVQTLFATGNDAVQWTPLAGSNWQEVAETAMDSDTSYNYTSTPGQQDTLNFGALAGTITTLYGIQLTYAARKDDAGARSVKSIVKIAGTSYAGATNSLPDDSYAYFTDQWILNPNTGLNWVISGVNGAAYGYNIVS